MLAGLIFAETHVCGPMLGLAGMQVLPVAACYCYVVLLVLLPRRFIGIEGHSEIKAGLFMIALPSLMLAVPFLAALPHAVSRWVFFRQLD
jgi:hypothetical protein